MTKELTQKIERLGLKLYQGTPDEDVIIAEWWDSLFGTEEFSNLVASGSWSLSNIYVMFKPPNMMAYTVADQQLESVHWAEPVSSSPHAIYFSSWCAGKIRGTKHQVVLMCAVYETLFSMGKSVIIGITKQEKLLDLHRKLGYVILDPVPYLFDSDPAWIMYLTRQNFERSRLYAAGAKILKEELN
jgi:hypothetical protein